MRLVQALGGDEKLPSPSGGWWCLALDELYELGELLLQRQLPEFADLVPTQSPACDCEPTFFPIGVQLQRGLSHRACPDLGGAIVATSDHMVTIREHSHCAKCTGMTCQCHDHLTCADLPNLGGAIFASGDHMLIVHE